MTDLTVGQRILLHVSLFAKFREEFECPEAVTQQGIATALGLSRSHVALELKKLVEEERVETHLAHVSRARTRRKVYFATATGARLAASMRSRADQAETRWIHPEGDLRETSGRDLLREAGRQNRPLTPVYEGILRGDVVDLRAEPEERRTEGAPMVGRQKELRRLRAWLQEPSPFLVLTGLPGIGKTTLARALLAEVEEGLWIKVLPFHRPASLMAAVAHGLARRGRTRLLAYLKGTPPDYAEVGLLLAREAAGLLLVFDDVGAAPEAAEVLQLLLEHPPPEAKVLLTARRAPPFVRRVALDASVETLRLDGLTRTETRTLLAALGADPKEATDAYRRTGGHPLLLRLGSAPGAPPSRQVEATLVAEILRELGPEEEEVIRRAAVFRRPVPIRALEPVQAPTLRALQQLGLLSESHGLFEVHDTVAPLLLQESPAVSQAAHRRAVAFWEQEEEWIEAAHHEAALGQVDRVLPLLTGHEEAILERGQAADLLDLLARLPASEGTRLAYPRARALDYLGRWIEALTTLDLGWEGADSEEQLRRLLLRGRLHSKRGEFAEAEEAFQIAAHLAREEGRDLERGQALFGGSIVLRKGGRLEEAQKQLAEASAIFERVGAEADRGRAQMELGIIELQTERAEEAIRWFRRSRRLLAASKVDSAYLQNNLGIALSRVDQPEASLAAFEESIHLAEASGMVRAEGYALANASDLYAGLGEVQKATAYCERSLAIFQDLEDPLMISACYANQAKVARVQGNLPRAESLYTKSLQALEGQDAPHSLAARWLEVGELYEEMGDLAQARAYRARAKRVMKARSAGGA